MTKRGRYPSAVERAKAKLAGDDRHPADGHHKDPVEVQVAEQVDKPGKKPRFKHLGGSENDTFNIEIANGAMQSAWLGGSRTKNDATDFAGFGLKGIEPRDPLEGMLAAQLIASHHAAMECFRRAMLSEQTLPGREMNLNQGNKASRTYATLLEALNRHRGKGQQRMRVEHVHVYPGGQAVVGHVEGTGGTGAQLENQGQSYAPAVEYQPSIDASMRGANAEREPVPRTGDGERSLPHARRDEPGRSEGTG